MDDTSKTNSELIMHLEYIKNLGKFDKGYQAKVRTVYPEGHVIVPKIAAVKVYTMVEGETDDSRKALKPEIAKYCIDELLRHKTIDAKMGLGFSIISEGALNIVMWGGTYPSVMNHNLYSFEGEISLKRLKRRDDLGDFCAWEGEICWV